MSNLRKIPYNAPAGMFEWQQHIEQQVSQSCLLSGDDFMQRNRYSDEEHDEGEFHATNEVTAPNEQVFKPHQKLLSRIGQIIFE